MLVAGRYLDQQYLIGPALIPVYWFVLRLMILWILVPVFFVIVMPIAGVKSGSPLFGMIKALWQFATSSIFVLGVVTFVFMLIE